MKCVMGCKHFTGGEILHDENCPFYPDSISIKYDFYKKFFDLIVADRMVKLQMLKTDINSKDGKLYSKIFTNLDEQIEELIRKEELSDFKL